MSTRRTAGVSNLLVVSATAVILISLGVWVRAKTIQSTAVSDSLTIGLIPAKDPKTYHSSCSLPDATDAANPYSVLHPGQFDAVQDQVLPHCVGQADDLGDIESQRVITVGILTNGDASGKPTGGTTTDQQMEAVLNYLSSQGVAVAPSSPRIVSLTATASIGAFEQALHVPIHTYRFKANAVVAGKTIGGPETVAHPELITFYAPEYDPLLPSAAGKFVYMFGLNDAPVDSGIHSFQPE